MANDPPTSLRMGFGYYQARAVGRGGVQEARSPRQVNRIVQERKAAREPVIWLQREVERDPGWEPYVKHRILESGIPDQICDELHRLKRYAWDKEKGYSLEWRLRRYER